MLVSEGFLSLMHSFMTLPTPSVIMICYQLQECLFVFVVSKCLPAIILVKSAKIYVWCICVHVPTSKWGNILALEDVRFN